MPRIVGLDYGRRRLGFAVSDPSGSIALLLRTVTVRGRTDALDATCAVCEETEATALVVGLPLHMDGRVSPMALEVREFMDALRTRLTIPVRAHDERLSTSLAERALLEADMSRAKRKKKRDKVAAQIILQGYLDSMPPEGCPDAEIPDGPFL